MSHLSKKGKLRFLIQGCLLTSISLPPLIHAQQAEPAIEELVVTGSYIRNSKFTGASPVDTISQDV